MTKANATGSLFEMPWSQLSEDVLPWRTICCLIGFSSTFTLFHFWNDFLKYLYTWFALSFAPTLSLLIISCTKCTLSRPQFQPQLSLLRMLFALYPQFPHIVIVSLCKRSKVRRTDIVTDLFSLWTLHFDQLQFTVFWDFSCGSFLLRGELMCLVSDLLPILVLIFEGTINMPSWLLNLDLFFEPCCSLLLQTS